MALPNIEKIVVRLWKHANYVAQGPEGASIGLLGVWDAEKKDGKWKCKIKNKCNGLECGFPQVMKSNLTRKYTTMMVFSQLDNGCAGTVFMSWSTTTRKVCWRVVGRKGTVDVERGTTPDGKQGYTVQLFSPDGNIQSYSSPFAGVHEELRIFAEDVVKVSLEGKDASVADKRSSVSEALSDLAVVEAMLRSSSTNGSLICVESIR